MLMKIWRKYGEKMAGKFSHNPDKNGIFISVTKPFVQEIHIECDGKIRDEFYPYSLLEPNTEHPKVEYRKYYYNTQEKRYYRSELKESEGGYTWVATDEGYIVAHNRKCEELQAHFRAYDNIHKGQLCVFTGYAIDPNGNLKKPSTVDTKFHRHKWFFNPWSFQVSLLNENTIDDFVEGTPISKEMTQKMVLYHQKQDEIKRQTEIDDQKTITKEKRETFLNKIIGHFEKYEKVYKYGVGFGIVWILGAILQLWALLAK